MKRELYDGDVFEYEGNRFVFKTEHDFDSDPPWEREDGHGPVSGWKRHPFGVGSKPPKAPGELILHWDHGSYRTYDFQSAVKIAKRDGWDSPPYKTGTKGEQAARAAMADYENLRAWCNDEWNYIGVIVYLADDDGEPMKEHSASLWGIESNAGEYLETVARELADEIVAEFDKLAA